jgi:hypothetical protein
MNEWQPIKTAPTEVGILVTDGKEVTICKLSMFCGSLHMFAVGLGGYEWEFDLYIEELTHWASLPSLPKAEKQ